MAGTSILGIVIGKLCYKKKLYPIILLKINKGLKIGSHCAILPLDLIVYLWIEGGKKSPLYAKEIV